MSPAGCFVNWRILRNSVIPVKRSAAEASYLRRLDVEVSGGQNHGTASVGRTSNSRASGGLALALIRFRSSIPFWRYDVCASSFAIACYASDACGGAGRFYDLAWCGIGCRSSGYGALLGAGSTKQDACTRSHRDCTKNAPDLASPLDRQLCRQHVSVFVPPPPLQHIEHLRDPVLFLFIFIYFLF